MPMLLCPLSLFSLQNRWIDGWKEGGIDGGMDGRMIDPNASLFSLTLFSFALYFCSSSSLVVYFCPFSPLTLHLFSHCLVVSLYIPPSPLPPPSLTVPPAVELHLQSVDDVLQTLVLVFLLVVLVLPLLSSQLQVHRHCVLDGLGSVWRVGQTLRFLYLITPYSLYSSELL